MGATAGLAGPERRQRTYIVGGGIGDRQDKGRRNERQDRWEDAVNALEGKKVAIVVANGFEQVEMTDPKKALEKAGAHTDIVSLEKEKGQSGTRNPERACPVEREGRAAVPLQDRRRSRRRGRPARCA